MASTDPYERLGLKRDASAEDVRKAYRKLAKQWHPDVNPDNSEAKRRFQDIASAYELLRDEASRRRYDRGEIDADGAEKPKYRRARNDNGAGPSAAGDRASAGDADYDDAYDFFSDIFSRRGTSPFRSQGADRSYQIEIDFLDAINGATHRVSLPDGTVLDVVIPPGTRDGQVLRLRGKGEPGPEGAQPGDARVRVAVRPHPYFIRDGDDIRLELPISLTEAVLDARIKVPTPTGPVMMTLRPGTNTGQVRRLKGKGVPVGAGHRGDQYITLKIMLPDTPDPELQAFAETWSAGKAHDPRRAMYG